MKLGLGKLDCETVKLGTVKLGLGNWGLGKLDCETVKLGTVRLGLETVTGKLGL